MTDTGGFASPAVAGSGQLIVPSIHSPNYNPGVVGWTIKKDGTVEFNSGVFRGTVTAGVFEGTTFEINSNGAFFYSGVPANGSLVASISPAGGTDPFGNVYHAVVAAGNQAAAYSRFGTTGILHMQNAAGNDVLQLDPGRSAELIYGGAPSASNLLVSVAAFQTTDALGNTILAGFTSYAPTTGATFVNVANGEIALGPMSGNVPDTAHQATIFGNANFLQLVSGSSVGSASVAQLFMLAGSSGAALNSGLSPQTQSYADSTTPLLDIIVGARVYGTIGGGGAITPTTWQLPSYGTNWAGSNTFNGTTGVEPLRFRIDAEDNLWPIGAFKAGAVAPADPVFILPAAYTPAAGTDFIPCLRNNGGAVTSGMLRISNNGHVDVLNALNLGIVANNEFLVNGKIPLRHVG